MRQVDLMTITCKGDPFSVKKAEMQSYDQRIVSICIFFYIA